MITSLSRPQHHDHPVGEVALVAGVQPAVGVLGRHRAVHGEVPGGDGVAAQLDRTDLAVAQHRPVLVDHPGGQPRQRRPQQR